ncbi:DUF4376 domain-containing protein [Thiohalorhabdus sp.]|uniref:DUF4376 domain-containing protein n=1 Tax=Thiohalorhabdus sp. TaxID=3094134 RepID=UPI002FC32BA5
MAGEKPHESALPVEYPDLSDVDRITDSVVQNPPEEWDVYSDYVEVTHTIEAYDVDKHREIKRKQAREMRKEVEDSGTTFDYDGETLETRTDRTTRDDVKDVKEQIDAGVVTEVDWEFQPHEWTTLDGAKADKLLSVIREHRRLAFDRQAELESELDAATDMYDLRAVSINSGWPS